MDERQRVNARPPGEHGRLKRGRVARLLRPLLLVVGERRLVDEQARSARSRLDGGAGTGVAADDEGGAISGEERVAKCGPHMVDGKRPRPHSAERDLRRSSQLPRLDGERQRADGAGERADDPRETARSDDRKRPRPSSVGEDQEQARQAEVVVGVQVGEQARIDDGGIHVGDEKLARAALAAVDEDVRILRIDQESERRARRGRRGAACAEKEDAQLVLYGPTSLGPSAQSA